ncbi:MAG: hypothetical protein AAB400_00645 [Patescibacteria group bacterium]
MESKIADLPQSRYKYSILDPSQLAQLECREGTQKGIITLSQENLLNILEWAYPICVYSATYLPKGATDVFPGFILIAINRALKGKGYTGYEVWFSEDANEYLLLGLKDEQRYHLAQWRLGLEVRTLREVVDDAAPYMHTYIRRHGATARLCFYLLAAAIASFIAYDRLLASQAHPSYLLYYTSWLFFLLSGGAVIWYILSFKKYQRASVIRMVENIENDIVGAISM